MSFRQLLAFLALTASVASLGFAAWQLVSAHPDWFRRGMATSWRTPLWLAPFLAAGAT